MMDTYGCCPKCSSPCELCEKRGQTVCDHGLCGKCPNEAPKDAAKKNALLVAADVPYLKENYPRLALELEQIASEPWE